MPPVNVTPPVPTPNRWCPPRRLGRPARLALLVAPALLVLGCFGTPERCGSCPPDGTGGAAMDAALTGAGGERSDAGGDSRAADEVRDGARDMGGPPDTALPDARPADAADANRIDMRIDTGPADTGPADAGRADGGPADRPADSGGGRDTGPPDTGPADIGPADTGPPDRPADSGGGPPDAGPADSGNPGDGGARDGGATDARADGAAGG